MRTPLILLAVLALAVAPAAAQDPDPLAAGTWGHGWFGGETVYSQTAETKTLGVGWAEGQVGFGRFAVAGTAGVTGAVGEVLNLDQPQTFAAFRGQMSVHYNLLGRSGAACGISGAAEYNLPLHGENTLYHAVTAGAGAVCSGQAWRAYVLFGQDAQMPGYAVMAYSHFPISSRVSWVTRLSVGEQQRFVAALDIVARIF